MEETGATPLYEALDPGRSEIRLLEILSWPNDDSVIKCRLVVVSLEDKPSYTALSYIWGDPSVTENIVVNGSVIAVTSNLASALQAIRHSTATDSDRRKQEAPAGDGTRGLDTTSSIGENRPAAFQLWADAICINQTDFPERNQQVGLMARIYQYATMVISWLGPGDEQITRTFDTIQASHTQVVSSLATFAPLDWMEEFPQIWEIDKDDDVNDFGSGIKALNELPYWRRIWTIQEMVYAKHLFFMSADSGDRLLWWAPLDAMLQFLHAVRDGRFSRPECIPSRSWATFSSVGLFESRAVNVVSQLQEELENSDRPGMTSLKMTDMKHFVQTLYHRATDPKDKIYSLLGLMELDVPVDYSSRTTVSDVYGAFAAQCVAAGSTSELLSMSGIGWDLLRSSDLPSWVPDLQALSMAPASSAACFGYALNASHHNANRNLKGSEWRFAVSYSLHACGCITGSVDQVQRRCEDQGLPSKEYFVNTCIKLLSKMSSSQEKLASPPLGAIFRTFLQDTDPNTVQRLYSNPSRVIKFARVFLYTILGVNPSKRADLEDLKLLGYHPAAESFEDFFQRQFLSDVPNTDPSEYSYARIRGSLFRSGLDLQNDASTLRILYEISNNLMRNRLFHTSGGGIGLGPIRMEPGDTVCVLDQCRFPVILRKVESHYVFVGCAYILGLMDGEAAGLVAEGKARLRELEIH